MQLAPAGDAYLGARMQEARQAEDAQAVGRAQLVQPRERGAGDRVQEVHRQRLHGERAQLLDHVDHVVVRLPHPEQRAGAERDPGGARGGERGHAVLVTVGARDLGVEALARVEVVVEPRDPGLGERARLRFVRVGPWETQTGMPTSARMRVTALLSLRTSGQDGPRVAITRQKRPAFAACARRAPSSIAASSTSG